MQTINEILKIHFPSNRKEVRKKVILKFLEELPGSGTKELASNYDYTVETLPNNKKIYLHRPAHLNKGMDFIIKTDAWEFRSKTGSRRIPAPAHHNIISDLQKKKIENHAKYLSLFSEIEKIYKCESYVDSICFNNNSMPTNLLLGLIKWLFIEQDVTYWNYSGRDMLMSGIRNI